MILGAPNATLEEFRGECGLEHAHRIDTCTSGFSCKMLICRRYLEARIMSRGPISRPYNIVLHRLLKWIKPKTRNSPEVVMYTCTSGFSCRMLICRRYMKAFGGSYHVKGTYFETLQHYFTLVTEVDKIQDIKEWQSVTWAKLKSQLRINHYFWTISCLGFYPLW